MKYLVADFKIATSRDSLLPAARDVLCALAGEAGFESFEETPGGVKGYVQDDLFDPQALETALADWPLADARVEYTIGEAEYKNWNAEWEETGFEPIVIDDKIKVYDARTSAPSHLRTLAPSRLIQIGIEARMAFGTATHETTRMMLSALLRCDTEGRRVLDCGCGTGILGIAASKFGATDVVAYDIDEWSVENARHNAELNDVRNMEVFHGSSQVLSHVSGVFDIVMANINRNVLLDDMAAFTEVMTNDGTLLLSGFYEADTALLVAKAKELGLQETGRAQENGWAALSLQRQMICV